MSRSTLITAIGLQVLIGLASSAWGQASHPYAREQYAGDTLAIVEWLGTFMTSGCGGGDSLVLFDSLGLYAVRQRGAYTSPGESYWKFQRMDLSRRQIPRTIRAEVVCDGSVTDSVYFRFDTYDVEARVGRKASGSIGLGEWRAQRGLRVRLRGYDASATLPVVGFTIRRIRAEEADAVWVNPGDAFVDEAGISQGARMGDRYEFTNVRYRSADGFGVLKVDDELVLTIAEAVP